MSPSTIPAVYCTEALSWKIHSALYKYLIANLILNSKWKEGHCSNCLFFHKYPQCFSRQVVFQSLCLSLLCSIYLSALFHIFLLYPHLSHLSLFTSFSLSTLQSRQFPLDHSLYDTLCKNCPSTQMSSSQNHVNCLYTQDLKTIKRLLQALVSQTDSLQLSCTAYMTQEL